MELIVDIGNTYTKIAVFEGNTIIHSERTEAFEHAAIDAIFEKFPGISASIISSVKEAPSGMRNYIETYCKCILLDVNTPLPFINQYKSDTLGNDRIAAVAGALALYPNKNVLVIDAGTCITYDLITSDKNYLGGSISPGIKMRFKAMHTFTSQLPLVEPELESETALVGDSTQKAILSGVHQGVLAEVDGIITDHKSQFPDLLIILSGGDHNYFDKYLKNNIFALPNIVWVGLKKILDFNEG